MYSDVAGLPIEKRIDWLFDLADRHGKTFRGPEAWLARQRYLAKHPTAIAVLKCMDGRINLPVMTNTPPEAILMPFRNLGGAAGPRVAYLGEVLAHHVKAWVVRAQGVLFLVTYHFSKVTRTVAAPASTTIQRPQWPIPGHQTSDGADLWCRTCHYLSLVVWDRSGGTQ
jgi:hypothetical protein